MPRNGTIILDWSQQNYYTLIFLEFLHAVHLYPRRLIFCYILDLNMEGLIGTGTGRTYEDFQRQIPEPVKPLFDKLRTYCMSLDEKVIEDVRMHRIVFCKTMTFRWFADIEPSQSSIIIKIQKERKVEPKILEVNPEQELSEVESLLKDAFMTIR